MNEHTCYPKDTSEDGVSQSINLKINVQVLGAEGDQGYQQHHQPPLPSPPPPPPAYTVTTPTPIATTYKTVVKPKEVVHHKKVLSTNSILFYLLAFCKENRQIKIQFYQQLLSWSQLRLLKVFLSWYGPPFKGPKPCL